jgi:hypothetical protein
MSGPADLTTSGDYEYDAPGTDIIQRAYQIVGQINEDETPTAGMYKTAIDTLNAMVKELMATGIHVWTEEEAMLFVQQYQPRYQISIDSAEHVVAAELWQLGTLGPNAPAAATSVTLSGQVGYQVDPLRPVPTKDMAFGVSLDNGKAFWTTIKDVPSANVIDLTDALPSSASGGSFAYWYDVANRIQRPLRVPAARRIDFNVGSQGSSLGPIETPLTNMMSRKEYMDLPQKTAPGQITQCFYNPARDVGEMFVWNVPLNVSSGLRFTYYRPIQIFTSVDDLADLPIEWDNALKWNLAWELAPQYDVAAERYDRIGQRAVMKLELVMGWDREPQSIYFGRGYDQTRR